VKIDSRLALPLDRRLSALDRKDRSPGQPCPSGVLRARSASPFAATAVYRCRPVTLPDGLRSVDHGEGTATAKPAHRLMMMGRPVSRAERDRVEFGTLQSCVTAQRAGQLNVSMMIGR
jgi:hypothetical protein